MIRKRMKLRMVALLKLLLMKIPLQKYQILKMNQWKVQNWEAGLEVAVGVKAVARKGGLSGKQFADETDPESTAQFPMRWCMNHPWMAARFFRSMAKQKSAEKEKSDPEDKADDGDTSEDAAAEKSNEDDAMEGTESCPRRGGRGRGRGCGRGMGRRWARWMKHLADEAGPDGTHEFPMFWMTHHPPASEGQSDEENQAHAEKSDGQVNEKADAPRCHPHPRCGRGPWFLHMMCDGSDDQQKGFAGCPIDFQNESDTDGKAAEEAEAQKSGKQKQNIRRCGRRGRGGPYRSMHHFPGMMMGHPHAMHAWHGHPHSDMMGGPFTGMPRPFMRQQGKRCRNESQTGKGEPKTPTEDIEEMVVKLESMGFENQDGYLEGLVVEHAGNIEKVLEFLQTQL
eukprot:GHVT01009754.1.p1 GENE.GHVT01009754.1~~GHVT01009754.1.p1  ORF type:complete len:396 (+),score=31.00 GHVT01009754.1:140-1327(+)